jgi:hypothetical protein
MSDGLWGDGINRWLYGVLIGIVEVQVVGWGTEGRIQEECKEALLEIIS